MKVISERTLAQSVVSILEKNYCVVKRIETNYTSGIPDINYCKPNGLEGWIELKYYRKRSAFITLRPEQHSFLFLRSRVNPRVFCVFGNDERCGYINKFKEGIRIPATSNYIVNYTNLESLIKELLVF